MMNKSLKILFLILLTIVPLTGCTKIFASYEDKLYSEKEVFGKQAVSTETSNVLTRENAIKKALDVFDKSLNIKINRTDFTENIKLTKNDGVGSLKWQITWDSANAKTFYTCILDSSTGDIDLIQYFNKSIPNKSITSKLSFEETVSLAGPLFKQLGIDLNNYAAVPASSYNYDNYLRVLFYKKNSKKKEFEITIDPVNKAVTGFVKLNEESQ